jgi:poly-gamma-glutamate capsule biosynthesis protein CapA/YwtB (metallophosphatase superfamily)
MMIDQIQLAAGGKTRIEIGRSGVFLAKRGGRVELTPKDNADIAASVEPSKRTVKLKIGHAEITTATPDCGVVLAAEYDAGRDRLFADVKPTEYLAQQNRNGAFTKISMELLRKGGRYVLDAIAFLGAHDPAIVGLEPVALAMGDNGGDGRVLVCAADESAALTESERIDLAHRGDIAAFDSIPFGYSGLPDILREYLRANPGVDYHDVMERIGERLGAP